MVALFFIAAYAGPTVAELDALAKARDVPGLSRFVNNLPPHGFNPLTVIKTNGAYECGKFGWSAFEMKSPTSNSAYVVLSTPLTSEDNGEFLFRRDGSKLHLVPEDDAMGVNIDRHTFDVTFSTSSKSVHIEDRFQIRTKDDSDFVFRMSPEFKVEKISNSAGKTVSFSQAGGIVILNKPQSGSETLSISYGGVVDKPLYSGSIGDNEATLTNSYWYPMVARQPAPYQVTVHYPKNWISVGQGTKTSESAGSATYKMDLPCVFYSLSAGPYKSGSVSDGGRTFFGWSPRLSESALVTQAETYPAIIAFYERFAKFPFKTYGALDSPGYGGGALEAYSYATYGGGLPYVDAHEPSHTWWGGIVDNTYLHSFWNESFAVYSDGLFHREWTGSSGNKLAFIPQGEVNPGYDQFACSTTGANYGAIASDLGYGKGSHVLFMLEELIGTGAMVKSMKRFIDQQPPQKAAEWEDFERAAEQENPDKHLETFFGDWLDRPGHIDFTAQVSFSDAMINIHYRPKDKPFRIPLEVLVQYADGQTETHVVDVRESKIYNIPVREKPVVVSIDPYRFLIRPIQENESPVEIQSAKTGMKVYVDPAHPEWATRFGENAGPAPSDRSGSFFVGSPDSWPAIADLFEKAGFKVSGTMLTYHGKTIDLNHGAAEAIIDLGGGKSCGIGIGKTRIALDPGSARVGIFDDLGRLLDGETAPKLSGNLTFRL